MHKEEFEAIKAICEKYGYGNVMTLASVLWERELEKEGYPSNVVFIPAPRSFLRNDMLKISEQSISLYREIAKRLDGADVNGV